ncbi:MAG: 50S ribosomal protein L21e [Candidatus Nanoarchaeia archaeon]
MVQRIGTRRRKARHILTKNIRTKGKVALSRFFANFKEGEKVLLKAEPAYHKGMYHLRYHGKTGVITGKRGACYHLNIKDGGKTKELIVHPVHLRKQ